MIFINRSLYPISDDAFFSVGQPPRRKNLIAAPLKPGQISAATLSSNTLVASSRIPKESRSHQQLSISWKHLALSSTIIDSTSSDSPHLDCVTSTIASTLLQQNRAARILSSFTTTFVLFYYIRVFIVIKRIYFNSHDGIHEMFLCSYKRRP